jgi:peroxiredoxin
VIPVAIVAQKPEAVSQYHADNQLPFPVLIDRSRDVLRAYGVWHRVGLTAWNIARPALFLIAQDGTVLRQHVGRRQDDFPEHAEILRWLEETT